MSLFVVNQEKCNKCGICLAVCPMNNIELNEQSSLPNPIKVAESQCFNCGHCVTVCPYGALSHKNMSVNDCPTVQKELLPSAEQVEQFLLMRRSIRNFKDKTVEREILEKLVEIARYAPSSHNVQSVDWVVVTSKDDLKKMVEMVMNYMRHLKKKGLNDETAFAHRLVSDFESGFNIITFGAPHVIVVHSKVKKNFAQINCTNAMAHLQLAALSYGLGTCCLAYFNIAAQNWPPLQNALSIPKESTVYGSILIGYPKYQYHRIPIRNKPEITWR